MLLLNDRAKLVKQSVCSQPNFGLKPTQLMLRGSAQALGAQR